MARAGLMQKRHCLGAAPGYYQGVGRFDPDAAMARGVADLGTLATLIPSEGYLHGEKPTRHRCRQQ
jgi:hypothetical protein